ncbi:SDR family oxidoreductase [bacterium]|nr:SDR family oxidoreductase [bacterium]
MGERTDDLQGRIIWLTGASGGLGPGIAHVLAEHGTRLALHARQRSEAIDSLVSSLQDQGYPCMATYGDLTEPTACREAVAAIHDRYGAPYALVHAAGSLTFGPIAEQTLRDLEINLHGNLTSLFCASQAVLPMMRDIEEGRIITFGMTGGATTQPMRQLGLHLAAKAGVTAIARTLAIEEAPHGIRVNVVAPGHIPHKTIPREQARTMPADPSHPLGVHGSYEDVAEAVLFLLQPSSDYITGAVLDVNGGWRDDDLQVR